MKEEARPGTQKPTAEGAFRWARMQCCRRQGVVAWAGASDEFGIPQSFPEVRELGWSGLSLQS